MTDERATILRAVCDDLPADPPRLVYADWLEEHGEEARAEFIRVQLLRARLDADDPRQADLALRAGHSVIVDAVHARENDRRAVEQVAAAASVPFIGLWLDAPERVLTDRAAQRRNDPSDADAAVIHAQRAGATGNLRWEHLDASGSTGDVLSSLALVPAAVGLTVFLFMGFEWVTPVGLRPDAYKRKIPWAMPVA